jgi:osmotically-inducible protein OsmY
MAKTKKLRFAALGAALVYFLDPDNGKRRRKVAADRLAGFLRRNLRKTGGLAQGAYALKQKAAHLKEQPKEQPDDVTLARKVETEIFRDAEVPKGQINVNAEEGVVYLRGEVEERDLIEDLGKKAHGVQGVLGVENLLHTPGEPAPAKSG